MDRIGDLGRHLFLDLQTFGMDLNHPRELTDANHTSIRNIAYPCLADYRRHVVLAVALESNAAQHNHFIITFDFFEGLLQNLNGVLSIADEKPFKRARRAGGSLYQTVPLWIVTGPSDNGSKRSLDIGSVGSLNLCAKGSNPLQRINI